MRSRALGRWSSPLLALLLAMSVTLVGAALSEQARAAEPGAEVEEEFLPGPAPSAPDAADNPAAPPEYEANFLWGAAAGLLVLVLVMVLALGLLYWLLVYRPRQRTDA